MKRLLCYSIAVMPIIFSGVVMSAPIASLVEVWRLSESLSRPESVVYDAQRNMLYVSNINGGSDEKNGRGYISRVSLDGAIIDAKWITGLNAPKGMAISDGRLYVADIDTVHEIDISSHAILREHSDWWGIGNLNDVAADADGNVYVSDSTDTVVYRLNDGDLEEWADDKRLSQPNGISAEADALVVAAGDSSVQNPGASRYLKRVVYKTGKIEPLGDGQPIGNLDGIAPDGRGGYFLTDWGAGRILHFRPGTEVKLLQEPGKGTADLVFLTKSQLLVVPVMSTGELIAYRVIWTE